MKDITEVTVADGKYTFRHGNGVVSCLRYGEEWIAAFVTGSNAIGQLLFEVEEKDTRIAELKGLLADNTSLRNTIQKQFTELREDKDKRIKELESVLQHFVRASASGQWEKCDVVRMRAVQVLAKK